jgi:transposase
MLHYGGYSSRRIARGVGLSKNTVLRILERAARYADQVKLSLIRTGKAPQDVAERLAELIRWRAAARADSGRAARRTVRPRSLRQLGGAWADEDCDAILEAIYRLRSHDARIDRGAAGGAPFGSAQGRHN